MKKSLIHLFSFLVLITFFTSCIDDEPDVPPIIIPTVDFEANSTIAALKATFNGQLDSIETDIIIKGIVVANDESGNFYKTIVIQDETSAIEVKLNKTNLYTEYKVGQLLYIKCKGMYLGAYNTLLQLGYNYNNTIGQLPEVMIPNHLFRDSLPGTPPEPKLLTFGTLTEPDLSKLVKFENIHFELVNVPYSLPDATTNRNLLDDNGNDLVLRTSNYSTFAAELTPGGKGTMTGILSKFGSTWQFYIRDLNDVVGFTPDTTEPIGFTEEFASNLGQFIAKSVTGNQVWEWANFDGGCAKMSGFANSVYNVNEDWLISPSVDLPATGESKVSFREAINYITNISDMKVLISTNYDGTSDPNTATWTELTGFTRAAGNSWTFIESGDVSLSAYAGQSVRVGFKYLSTSAKAATWEIGKVEIGN